MTSEATIAKLEQTLKVERALFNEKEKELKSVSDRVSELEIEVLLLGKVDQVITQLSGKVMGESTKIVDRLVTSGLRVVFDDMKFEFKTKVEKIRNRTGVKFELYDDGRTYKLTDSFGGGVLAVVGVLLRVVTIILLKQRRVLLLDETLAHVSEKYQANTSNLLKKLCGELGFTILLVSHQEEFATKADTHYRLVGAKGDAEFRVEQKN